MSLLEELEARGVTAEDLEKAASVRLFEKAAAAEGVNLDDLEENQVEELYAHFVSNNLSDADNTKEASAMNDEIVDLFEKTAAAEGIDLDEMADDELAQLYNHYVENVLPEQMGEKQASDEEIVFDMFQKTAAAEGLDLNEFNQYELQNLYGHYVENVLPLQLGDEDATDKVASAHEKLAEAEILGRHMARSYADEMDKLAEEKETMGERARRFGQRAGDLAKNLSGYTDIQAGRDELAKAKKFKDVTSAEGTADAIRAGRRQIATGVAKGTGSLAVMGGLGYGAKKLYDRRKKGQEKKSGFSEIEVDALLKIAQEAGPAAAEDAKEGIFAKGKRKAGEYGSAYMSAMKGEGFDGGDAGGLIRHMYGKKDGKALGEAAVTRARQIGLARGGTGLAAAGLAYGGKKLYDRRKRNQEKRSSAYDYDDLVNEVALEMLYDAGYDV